MPKYNAIHYPVQEIASRIEAGETQETIARDLAQRLDPRITAKLIYKVCKKHAIHCQRTGPRAAEGHPNWAGGRIVDRAGYVFVYAPDHHDCLRINREREAKSNGKYYRKEKYAHEHRLVMEKNLGRPLLATEVVHHRDDNPQNNAIENLQLFDSNSQHLAATLLGKCPKWTPRGLANMRAAGLYENWPELAPRYDFRQLACLMLAIQKELALDVPPSKIEIDHYLAQRGTGIVEACETALAHTS
jgi:hypothetical protein